MPVSLAVSLLFSHSFSGFGSDGSLASICFCQLPIFSALFRERLVDPHILVRRGRIALAVRAAELVHDAASTTISRSFLLERLVSSLPQVTLTR
jgi:hypothetical protein